MQVLQRRGGFSCVYKRWARSARIRPGPPLGATLMRRASEWSGTSLRLLQHGALSSTLLRQHSRYWGRVHSAVHTLTAMCVFLTVPASIVKDELPDEEERAIAVLTTLTAALPFVASILLVVTTRLAPRRKWAALQLAAHRCEAELWAYRTRAGPYASEEAMDAHLVQTLQEIWEDLPPTGQALHFAEEATYDITRFEVGSLSAATFAHCTPSIG